MLPSVDIKMTCGRRRPVFFLFVFQYGTDYGVTANHLISAFVFRYYDPSSS